jgi:type VI secretion system protein ImpL
LIEQVGGSSESVAVGQARGELVNRYNTQVVHECRSITSNRYPFAARSAVDVPLADFGRLFGAGGVFDAFFKENLQALVDTSRNPWNWRAGTSGSLGVSLSMLRQFETAQRIRDSYFQIGGQLPEVKFNVTPAYLDAAASRFTFEIDGQSVDYRHGPERTQPMVWPGPSPGVAAMSFEDRSGAKPNLAFQGPWALFRLLDAAVSQPQSDVRYATAWQVGGHEARITIEANSVRNPFTRNLLRQFSCGG